MHFQSPALRRHTYDIFRGIPSARCFADVYPDNESFPGTPAASKAYWYTDSTTKRFTQVDDLGNVHGVLSTNRAIAAQGAIAATEVYLTGSNLLIPSCGMKLGMTFVWLISAVKTAAGIAAPIWTFRVGPAGAVGDTSRLALTSGLIQTAAIGDGNLIASVTVQIASSVGVIAGSGGSGPAPFGGGGTGVSGTFDNTVTIAGQYIGLTVTTGASAVWTVNGCAAILIG